MRIGIFGGSFDPPHRGHLEVAKSALGQANLDKIIFIPAKQNPHKEAIPHASDNLRVKMLYSLIGSDEKFIINEIELNRPSPSYSVDTIRKIRSDNPNNLLFLIIGSDTLSQLDKWKDSQEIINTVAGVIVYPREGFSAACPNFLESSKLIVLSGDFLEESSTMLRALFLSGDRKEIIRSLPESVLKIIEENKLYGLKSSATTGS